jgi:hypothetical protein
VTRIRKRCTLELESPRELVLRFHGAAGQNTPAAYEATTPTAEQIAARFGEGPIWLAEQEGDVVGTVSVCPNGHALHPEHGGSSRSPGARNRGGSPPGGRKLRGGPSLWPADARDHAVPPRRGGRSALIPMRELAGARSLDDGRSPAAGLARTRRARRFLAQLSGMVLGARRFERLRER